MKHTLCDLQEKIFHLQIQLLEEDIAGGERAGADCLSITGILVTPPHSP